MAFASVEYQRLYYNAAGDLLRTDIIKMSGEVRRRDAFYLGVRPTTTSVSGHPIPDYGTWLLHSNGGRRIESTTFIGPADRVVSSIESTGPADATGTTVTWNYGPGTYTIDLSDLPEALDTV